MGIWTKPAACGLMPLTVTFTNATTGDVTGYGWDFGDGSTLLTTSGATSTLTHPAHTYTAAGTYSVTLSVSGPCGTHALTRVGYITAQTGGTGNVAPLAYAGPDQSTDEGTPVSFTGAITDTDSPTGHTVLWDFGDGMTVSGTLTPTHTYGDNGPGSPPAAYTVTLTVTDTTGLSATDTLVVTAANVVPAVTIRWANRH